MLLKESFNISYKNRPIIKIVAARIVTCDAPVIITIIFNPILVKMNLRYDFILNIQTININATIKLVCVTHIKLKHVQHLLLKTVL